MSDFNKNQLFMEPKTKQYGSHMVMTNVQKNSKTKYINIDTQFRDEYNYMKTSNYNITLPERVNEIKDLKVTNIEIPLTYFIISENLGNNYFKITVSGTESVITIADGNYTSSSLQTAINTALSGKNLSCTLTQNSFSSFVTSSGTIKIEFDVDKYGNSDKYNFKSKLGWLLGFRNTTYDLTTNATTSEGFLNLNGPNYLYLAVDEFNKSSNQNSFSSPLFSSMVNKNILARIVIDHKNYTFGDVLVASIDNGYLLSDTRNYTGKIDLQKLNIQLLNETGIPMNLNSLDFSFCLEVTHE
tara:strand:+ start:421 stop:1317 length:897 start_codon:yes stop_codon:yes gene_type:complete